MARSCRTSARSTTPRATSASPTTWAWPRARWKSRWHAWPAPAARTRARYDGVKSCRAASLVSGGGKGCSWGCLGLADCEVVCDFDAITMNRHGLPVVDEDKCTACGDCVEVCPKALFSL